MAVYDEDGNLVEDVVPASEVADLKKAADEATKLKEALELKEAELTKLRGKDNNFQNIKRKAEDVDKLMEKASEREKLLYGEITTLKDQLEAKEQATVGKARQAWLDKYAGKDKDYADKLGKELEKVETVDGKPQSEIEARERVETAVALLEHRSQRQVNPLNTFSPAPDQTPLYGGEQKKSYADTPEGKELGAELGLTLEEPQKK